MEDTFRNNWSRSETTKLIELYKSFPLLYNHSDSSYLNRTKKDECLVQILKQIRKIKPKLSLSDMKVKLRTLRQQYHRQRALILQAIQNGKNDYLPSLWCYKQLTFFENSLEEPASPNISISNSLSDDPILIRDSRHVYESPIAEVEEVECDNLSTFRATHRLNTNDLHSMAETALKLVQQSAKRKKETANEKKRNAFAEYIAQELSKIEDEEIAEDTQFSMILLLRDALKKDRQQRKSL